MPTVKSSVLPDTIHLTKTQYESAPEDVQDELWRLGQRVRELTRTPDHTCPDGPFTVSLLIPFIVIDDDGVDTGQMAEVSYSVGKGRAPNRYELRDGLMDALDKTKGSLNGFGLRFMTRPEFENYVITGSPDISFATSKHEFAFDLENKPEEPNQ